MEILIELSALDTTTGSRVVIRAGSADDKRILAANSSRWWPAITAKPSLSHDWFDGDFTGQIGIGTASLSLSMWTLKRQNAAAPRFALAAAPITIYEIDPAVGTATAVFKGIVDDFRNDREQLRLTAAVDVSPFQAAAMTLTYAGTGGTEGPADLKNKVKPWCLGNPQGVEPVLIDVVNNVYQVSAYGAIEGITAVYERASSFGASFGDYASYAALVSAGIPAGRWGTCLAAGMIRIGAPAYGVITADVQGDKPSGTWIRKTGEIINRICTNAGVSGALIDSASLTALDADVARNISLYLTDQAKVIDLAQRLARPCNAAAGVSWLGKIFVVRTVIGTPGTTINAQGRQKPPVLNCAELKVSPPFWRSEMTGVRCWRTHAASEIAFYAEVLEKGDYAGATTYREGNIVTNQGARWIYVNPTATAGNAPPTLPTTTNSYWDQLVAAGPKSNKTFRQANPPGAANDGDLWFDTDFLNKQYRLAAGSVASVQYAGTTVLYAGDDITYSNGEWVEVRDQLILEAQRTANTKNGIVASGLARNGDVLTFPAVYDRVPNIVFGAGGVAAPSGANIVVAADGLTTSGFTMRAVYQTVGTATLVTDTGATTGGVGEPSFVINRTASGAPFDGRFTYTYSVVVPPPRDLAPGEPGEPGSITIGCFVKRSGAWIEVGSAFHNSSGTFSNVITPGAVDFGAGAEFGVSVTAADGIVRLSAFISVAYATASVSGETTLTPANSSAISWSAVL